MYGNNIKVLALINYLSKYGIMIQPTDFQPCNLSFSLFIFSNHIVYNKEYILVIFIRSIIQPENQFQS